MALLFCQLRAGLHFNVAVIRRGCYIPCFRQIRIARKSAAIISRQTEANTNCNAIQPETKTFMTLTRKNVIQQQRATSLRLSAQLQTKGKDTKFKFVRNLDVPYCQIDMDPSPPFLLDRETVQKMKDGWVKKKTEFPPAELTFFPGG